MRSPKRIGPLVCSAILAAQVQFSAALPGDMMVSFTPPAGATSMTALDVDSAGRVLALARISNVERQLVRYLANGSLDTTFQEPAVLNGRTSAAAFLSDDTVIAAGTYFLNSQEEGAVHLLLDGSLDPAFDLETTDTLVTSRVYVIPGDRFWLAGQFFNDLLEGSFIAAHNADGSLIDRPFINREGSIRASLADPDGNLVYAMRFEGVRTLHRSKPDGSAAPPFPTTFAPMQFLDALVRAADGSYLAGGYLRNFPAADIAQIYGSTTGGAPQLGAATGRVEMLELDGAGQRMLTGLLSLGPIDLSGQALVRLHKGGALDFNFEADFSGLAAAVSEVTSILPLAGGSLLVGLELADGSGALVQLAGGDPPSTAPEVEYLSPGVEARQYQALELQVWASGFPVPSIQWRKDGFDIPGATGNLLSISAIGFADAGTYTAALSNGSGSVTSAPVALTVRAPVPGDLDTRWLAALETGSLTQLIPLPDGRLLGRGFVRADGLPMQVLRFEPDGSVDPAFQLADFAPPGSDPFVVDLARATDGSLLLTYEWFDDDAFLSYFPVVRLNPDGSLDRNLNVPDFAQTSFLQLLDDGSFLAEHDFGPRWFDANGNTIALVDQATSYHQSTGGALLVYAGDAGDWPSGPGLYEIAATGDRDAGTHIPLPAGLQHLRILPDGSLRALRQQLGTWRVATFSATGIPGAEYDTGLESILAVDFADDGAARVYGHRDDAGTMVFEAMKISADLAAIQTVVQTGDITALTTASGYAFAPDDSLLAWGNLPSIAGFPTTGFARFYTGFQVEAAPVISLGPLPRVIDAGEVLHLRAVTESWPRPGFQWLRDGVPIAGATGPALYLPKTDFSDGGEYSVTLSSEFGSVTSAPASVFVHRGFSFESRDGAGLNTFRLPTVAGRRYHFERNSGLSGVDWMEIEFFDGDGIVRELTDDAPAVPAQFYRVRVDRPDLGGP